MRRLWLTAGAQAGTAALSPCGKKAMWLSPTGRSWRVLSSPLEAVGVEEESTLITEAASVHLLRWNAYIVDGELEMYDPLTRSMSRPVPTHTPLVPADAAAAACSAGTTPASGVCVSGDKLLVQGLGGGVALVDHKARVTELPPLPFGPDNVNVFPRSFGAGPDAVALAAVSDERTALFVLPRGTQSWHELHSRPHEATWDVWDAGVDVLGVARGGKVLYSGWDAATDRIALLSAQRGRAAPAVVASRADEDVLGALLTSAGDEPAAIQWSESGWDGLAEGMDRRASAALDAPARVHSIERCRTGGTWLLSASSPRGPATLLHDPFKARTTRLLPREPQLQNERLGLTKPFSFATSDDLQLHGFVTLPPGKTAADGPFPTVLKLRGGPALCDTATGFDPEAQLLAQQGFAVARLNYRGSEGCGRAFALRAEEDGVERVVDDVLEAVTWLVDTNVAAERAVAVLGYSYGGMLAASAAARGRAHHVACAVAVNAPAASVTVGVAGPLKPMPVLLAVGGSDEVVEPSESDCTEELLKGADAAAEVERLAYPSEGHAMRFLPNVMHLSASIDQFLAKHVPGAPRPEPLEVRDKLAHTFSFFLTRH